MMNKRTVTRRVAKLKDGEEQEEILGDPNSIVLTEPNSKILIQNDEEIEYKVTRLRVRKDMDETIKSQFEARRK